MRHMFTVFSEPTPIFHMCALVFIHSQQHDLGVMSKNKMKSMPLLFLSLHLQQTSIVTELSLNIQNIQIYFLHLEMFSAMSTAAEAAQLKWKRILKSEGASCL